MRNRFYARNAQEAGFAIFCKPMQLAALTGLSMSNLDAAVAARIAAVRYKYTDQIMTYLVARSGYSVDLAIM